MSEFENWPLRKFGEFEKASFRKWLTSKIDFRSDRFGSDPFPNLPLFLSLHNTINFHSTKNKINVILALFIYARSVVHAYFNYNARPLRSLLLFSAISEDIFFKIEPLRKLGHEFKFVK